MSNSYILFIKDLHDLISAYNYDIKGETFYRSDTLCSYRLELCITDEDGNEVVRLLNLKTTLDAITGDIRYYLFNGIEYATEAEVLNAILLIL